MPRPTGPRKACERQRRTDAAMKDGKTFDGTLSEARKGGERRGLERASPSGGDWQGRQNQGRHGATSLGKLLPDRVLI